MRYHGDGQFSDRGFFSYPRYIITFPDIQLTQLGEHHFPFRGLPSEEMSLVLVVKDRQVNTWEESAPLSNLHVRIEAALTDDKGQSACRAVGSPAPTNEEDNWVLTWSGTAAYWHHHCNFFQVHTARPYDMVIRVTDVHEGIDKVVVTPKLTGGGLELP